jgi:hypothetical protein
VIQADTFHDLLIFGAEIQDISKPFLVGNLAMYPDYDVGKALGDFNQNTVLLAVKSGAIYSKYKRSMTSAIGFSTLRIEDVGLLPLRLFKEGWIISVPIGPKFGEDVEKIYRGFYAPATQMVYPPKKYPIKQDELPKIREIYQKLTYVPDGYIESALERFSRSYDYLIHGNLNNCLEGLALAFESVVSRVGDSNQHTASLRTALLLGNSLYDRVEIQKQVKKLYEVRSMIGDKRWISEKDFYQSSLIVEDSQNLVRAVLAASVNILGIEPSERASFLPETMELVIDSYLFDTLRGDHGR